MEIAHKKILKQNSDNPSECLYTAVKQSHSILIDCAPTIGNQSKQDCTPELGNKGFYYQEVNPHKSSVQILLPKQRNRNGSLDFKNKIFHEEYSKKLRILQSFLKLHMQSYL